MVDFHVNFYPFLSLIVSDVISHLLGIFSLLKLCVRNKAVFFFRPTRSVSPVVSVLE